MRKRDGVERAEQTQLTQSKTIVVPENIARVEARLFRLPVEPPRGDAIQRFEALELPLVQITDGAGRVGVGFGYTIGAGGTANMMKRPDWRLISDV